jgi:hypothetical protein
MDAKISTTSDLAKRMAMTDDEMPEEVRAIMEAEWNSQHRRMCLSPALLSGNWRAFLPIDLSGIDTPGDQIATRDEE